MQLDIVFGKTQTLQDMINLMQGRVDAGPLGNNPLTSVALRSDAIAEFLLSQIVRDIALSVRDEKISKQILSTGRSMLQSASAGLAAGWEDGDDICPPYFHWPRPWPWPGPWPGPYAGPTPNPWYSQVSILEQVGLNPQPLPPREFSFADQFGVREIVLAELLRVQASLTVSKEFNSQLKTAALQLMKSAASSKVYDDFDNRCGTTGPRKPIPRPHGPVVKEELKQEFAKYS